MIKKTLFLYILLISNSVYCQIDDNQIRKIKDYTNAYIIYKRIDNDTSDKDCKRIKTENLFPANSIENPIPISKLSEFLINNGLSITKNKILDKIEKIEIDKSINIKEVSSTYLEKVDFELGNTLKSQTNFIKNKAIIKSKIDEFLKINSTSGSIRTEESVDNLQGIETSDITTHDEDKTSFFGKNWLSIFHWILTFSLIGLAYYFYKQLSILNKRIDRRKEEFTNMKINDSSLDSTQYDSKIKSLSSDISQLRLTIYELEKFIKTGNQSNNFNSNNTIDSKPPVLKNDYYFNKPFEDYFDNTYISDSPTNTIYKFFKVNQNNAEFEIHTLSTSISDIITNRQTSIIPACDEKNSPPLNVSKIITVTKGQAKLDGNKWKITKKALIKYE